MLKCLILDLDGTLVKTNEKHLKSLKQAFFQTTGVKLKGKEIIPLFGETVTVIMLQLAKKHNAKLNLKKAVALKNKLFKKSMKNCKGLSKAKFKLLKELKKHFLLALATGSSKNAIKTSLKKKDVKLFDFVVSADDCRKGKPSPEIYKKILQALKTKPAECLVIGDSPKDLIPARKLGIKSIGVFSGFNSKKSLQRQKPLTVLNNVLELNHFLKTRFDF